MTVSRPIRKPRRPKASSAPAERRNLPERLLDFQHYDGKTSKAERRADAAFCGLASASRTCLTEEMLAAWERQQ